MRTTSRTRRCSKKYGTRGVIHTWANPDGTQKIESTGPLDQEAHGDDRRGDHARTRSISCERAKKANKPFFLWWNSTRMHIWTQLKKESQGKTGLGIYPDGMVEHDARSASCSTSSRSSASTTTPSSCTRPTTARRRFTWPDGGTSPFRGEKNTNWEGGYRVPCCHPLARRDQARHRPQRHLRARGHAARRCWPPPACPTSRSSS